LRKIVGGQANFGKEGTATTRRGLDELDGLVLVNGEARDDFISELGVGRNEAEFLGVEVFGFGEVGGSEGDVSDAEEFRARGGFRETLVNDVPCYTTAKGGRNA